MYEYDTLDNAVAALNKTEGDGVVFETIPDAPVHTKRLWYSLRAGRCPQKLMPLVSKVWLRPIRKPGPPSAEPPGSSGDQNCGTS